MMIGLLVRLGLVFGAMFGVLALGISMLAVPGMTGTLFAPAQVAPKNTDEIQLFAPVSPQSDLNESVCTAEQLLALEDFSSFDFSQDTGTVRTVTQTDDSLCVLLPTFSKDDRYALFMIDRELFIGDLQAGRLKPLGDALQCAAFSFLRLS